MDRRHAGLDSSLAALAAGDRAAFDAVYALAQPAVCGFLRRVLRGDPEAEDVAQRALLKVFERASEYDASRPAMPWILGIAAWEARTLRRQRSRRRVESASATILDGLPDPGDDPGALAIHRELLDELERVLGRLRPTDVETLRAALGHRERPDVDPATFRKRLQRAMGRLRAAWGDRHGA